MSGINSLDTRLNTGRTRQIGLFAAVAVAAAFVIVYGIVAAPSFTDAFYHFNAAQRLVSGQGLTDPYLWTYIGAPDSLPAPSHLYWMPLTSLVSALGMAVLNAPGSYAAAQLPLALMLAGTAGVGFGLGAKLGGGWRTAWMAGLLTLASGFYTRFWGSTDTFVTYALPGALGLLLLGMLTDGQWRIRVVLAAGVCAGLAHLARADGLLVLIVGGAALLWPVGGQWRNRIGVAALLTLFYGATMLPWFVRNQTVIGTPMPLGGTQAIWFTEYDDLFNYPPDSSPAGLFAEGLNTFLASRWEAFSNNLGTFVAVEGLIVMTPLMLFGLWRRRQNPFLRPFILYALGLHLAMTFVFPFPGYRGGLLHSAAALVPWWAALGVVGLDDALAWAVRRRRWNKRSAMVVFSAALLAVAVFLSLTTALPNRVTAHPPPAIYSLLQSKLPPDARVMLNDPAALYYYTGMGGVVLPNEAPAVIADIAQRYGVRYLLLENVTADGRASSAASPALWPILTDPPAFLVPVPLERTDVRLYEIR
jgi:hypothetical protein